MTIFHTSIITTLQPPKEKQIIPVYNGVGTQRATLKNISIKLLNQKLNGFVIEIVGYDGETFSNSLFLEKECGRSGLLVDANSCTYELMLGKDRNYFMKNACISNTIPNMTFIIGEALTSVKEITEEKHQQRIDADALLYEKDET